MMKKRVIAMMMTAVLAAGMTGAGALSVSAAQETAQTEAAEEDEAVETEDAEAADTEEDAQTEEAEAGTEAETRTVIDAKGNEVTIPYEVTKVAPSIGAFAQVTEMLLNGNGKIVAAATAQISDDFKAVFTDYTESNANDYDASSVEDLIASGAQVVYGPSSAYSEEQLAQLEEAGIAYVDVSNLSDSQGIMESFRLIGQILGEEEEQLAEEFCEYYQASIDDCTERTKDLSEEEKTSVLRISVTGGSYTTVNKTDIFTSIVQEAGGINVAADYEAEEGGQGGQQATGGPQSGLPVDAEQIITWNPDVIITMNNESVETIKNDPALADVTAVAEGKVYASPQGLYLWGVRSGENAMMTPWLGTILYPELFEDVDMRQIVKDFFSDWYHTEITDEEADAVLAGK